LIQFGFGFEGKSCLIWFWFLFGSVRSFVQVRSWTLGMGLWRGVASERVVRRAKLYSLLELKEVMDEFGIM